MVGSPSWSTALKRFATTQFLRRILAVVLLFPAVWVTVQFLLEEAVDPNTFVALVIDRVLQVLVLFVLGPCLIGILLLEAKYARLAAVIAACIGAALSATILPAGLLRSGGDARVLAVALVAFVGSAVLLLWQIRHVEGANKVPIAIGAGVVGLALPILQFLQASSFLPSQTDVSVAQEVTVTVQEAVDSTLATEISYKLTNETDQRVLILGSRLEVCYSNEMDTVEGQRADVGSACFTQYEPIAPQAYIAKASSLAWRTVVAIPSDQRAVKIQARIAFARGDRLRFQEDAKDIGNLGTCTNVMVAKAEEESRYKGLAQRDKFLVYSDSLRLDRTHYHLQFDQPTDCWWDSTKELDARAGDRGHGQLKSYFGVTEAYQVQRFWVEPPEPPER